MPIPPVAPKARTTVTARFSAPAFTGNSPAPKITAVWKNTKSDDHQRPQQVQLSPTGRAAVGPSLGGDALHRAARLT
jgi:hypothetical protein